MNPNYNYCYCNTGVGITEIKEKEDFSISPNPFSSSTTLRTNKSFTGSALTIYNTLGQIVSRIENIPEQGITLQRDNLKNGLYYLTMMLGDKTLATKKMIIID